MMHATNDMGMLGTVINGVALGEAIERHGQPAREKRTFAEAIEKQLGVMDLTALIMCMEHNLPVEVFDFKVNGEPQRVVAGERVGTLVTN